MILYRFADKSLRYSFTHVGIIEVSFNDGLPYWSEAGSPILTSFEEFKNLVKRPRLTEKSFLKACESVQDQHVDIGCQEGFIVNGMLIIKTSFDKDRYLVIYDEFPEYRFSFLAERFFSLYSCKKKYKHKDLASYKLFLDEAKKIPWLRDRISEYLKLKSKRKVRS